MSKRERRVRTVYPTCDLCGVRMFPKAKITGGLRHKACHLALPPDAAWDNPDHDVLADIRATRP